MASVPSDPRAAAATVPRWLGPGFLLLAVSMLPWTGYLAVSLPSRHLATHYDAAWVGFDLALVVALAATGWSVWRGRQWVELLATVTATLLVVDAWFDVLTSQGDEEVWVALASALLLELPLAAVCLWIALHAGRVRSYRLQLLRAWVRRRRDA